MLLSDFRTQARVYLDDENADRWSNAVIDFAAQGALRLLAIQYAKRGGTGLDRVLETTASSGALDLSSYNPLKINSVSLKSGTSYYPVSPIRAGDRVLDSTSNHELRIDFQAAPTFPQGDGYSFDYGVSTVDSAAMDNLLVVLTVKQLMTIDGERHLISTEMEDQYWDAVLSESSPEGAFDMLNTQTNNFYGSQYGWSMQGQTLKISQMV